MQHPSLQKSAIRPSPVGAGTCRALAVLVASCLSLTVGQAQVAQPQVGQAPFGQPQFGRAPQGPPAPGQLPQNMSGQPQLAAPTPAEYQAFIAASSQPSGAAQVSALQHFIAAYPRSGLTLQASRLLASAAARSFQPQAGTPAGAAIPSQKMPSATANPQPAPSAAPQISQQPAHRAIIDLAPNTLTIRADNSSLAQIFRDLSTATGLKVDGLAHDERIYGSFGPGEPHEVISALVNGLGYNFLMVGESSRGVPRQLILSVQAPEPGTAGQTAQVNQANAGNADMDEEAVQDDQQMPEPQGPIRSFVPPQIQQGTQGGPGANRTTQQMLDELRQLHPADDAPQPDLQQQPQ